MREHSGYVATVAGTMAVIAAIPITVGISEAQAGGVLIGNVWFVLGLCIVILSVVVLLISLIMYFNRPRRGHGPPAGNSAEETGESPPADASDKEVLLPLIRKLGERRVLTDAYMEETENLVLGSVRDIRGWLTDALTELPADSAAVVYLIRLREVTNQYLTFVENRKAFDFRKWEPIRKALMKLRDEFKTVLSEICEKYTLQSACDLANSIERELQWGWGPETVTGVIEIRPR